MPLVLGMFFLSVTMFVAHGITRFILALGCLGSRETWMEPFGKCHGSKALCVKGFVEMILTGGVNLLL